MTQSFPLPASRFPLGIEPVSALQVHVNGCELPAFGWFLVGRKPEAGSWKLL
jgi:hypothetical protein